MRLLITGVSGLLGINLAYLASRRFEISGVLRGERAVAAPGRTPFTVIEADLTRSGQVERVLDQAQPDAIIHCAALTEVDRCEAYPAEAHRLNTLLPQALARAARRDGVSMLHISTDAVFDGLRGDYSEDDLPVPINTYARTKLAGERAVAEEYPEALIARVNFYGWSWQGRRSLAEFFYNNLATGTPFYGYDDVVFCPLLVNDLVETLLCMLDLRLTGLYHVVSADCLSKYEFAQMLARAFGFDPCLVSPASYKTGNMKAPRSPLVTLRSDKLSSALGEALPDQKSAMERFARLHQEGYPQVLRSLLVEPDHLFAG